MSNQRLSEEQRARYEAEADRAAWWKPRSESWPYPTHAAFADWTGTDAEWLGQAFREAVGRVHDYGLNEPDDPLMMAVRRAADGGDADAQAVAHETLRHRFSEDPDYDCPHPFCVAWWPMVRAAEARAGLDAERAAVTRAGLVPPADEEPPA